MMLIVAEAPGARESERTAAGGAATSETAKLFTSTNLSNQPMQRLLARPGWRSVGIIYGLDEGDPELFFLAPAVCPTWPP